VYLALGEGADAEGIYEQGMGRTSEREYNRDALEAIRDIDKLVAPAAPVGSNEAGIVEWRRDKVSFAEKPWQRAGR